jgi:predicted DsbA family dithiol-disulfide isomerase
MATLDDDVEWRMWQAPPEAYPVTTLPAMEAVQAVSALGDARGAEALDLALRDAMFRHSRCISLVPVILETARGVAGIDVDALSAALDDGRARSRVRLAPEEVTGSPYLVLSDGSSAFNPGLRTRIREGHLPVVEADDVSVLEGLLLRASSG